MRLDIPVGERSIVLETGKLAKQAGGSVTARLGDGQRMLVFVVEPAPIPLATGQTVHFHLPADAFMVLARVGAPA